jgi:pheromone shutdown-related protein TraB
MPQPIDQSQTDAPAETSPEMGPSAEALAAASSSECTEASAAATGDEALVGERVVDETVADRPAAGASDLASLTASLDEPLVHVERDGVHYTLLGTAHISAASAEAVTRLAESKQFDAIAIELCDSRLHSMTNPDAWSKMDLFELIRSGKAGVLFSNLVLSAYQQRLAEQVGVEPGAEMKAAIKSADQHGLMLQAVDREVGTTLRRVYRGLSLGRRFLLLNALIASIFTREEISTEDIEQLKQGDMLESAFSEFATSSPALYERLIAERDRFMAARLRQENEAHPGRRVLLVIGAGHLAGTVKALQESQDDPAESVRKLSETPPPARWPKLIPWAILILVLTGFGIGFSRSPELGWQLVVNWVLINGGLAGLGALIARGHPLTVLSAIFAAPLTSLNPTVGAGMVTAAVEVWKRRPEVADFEKLREDVTEWSGWTRNRVARTLLVFFMSNFGSMLGTYIAGWSIVKALW